MNVVNTKVTYYLAGLLAGSTNPHFVAKLKQLKGMIKIRNADVVSSNIILELNLDLRNFIK